MNKKILGFIYNTYDDKKQLSFKEKIKLCAMTDEEYDEYIIIMSKSFDDIQKEYRQEQRELFYSNLYYNKNCLIDIDPLRLDLLDHIDCYDEEIHKKNETVESEDEFDNYDDYEYLDNKH